MEKTDNNIYSAIIRVMKKACEQASQAIARDIMEVEKLQVSQKAINDFVTATDIKAENVIVKELRTARPHYRLLLEEGGIIEPISPDLNSDYEYTWIVDPIDGTSNFMHANPNFAISIALRCTSKTKKTGSTLSMLGVDITDYLGMKDIVVGMIYLPATNEIYWAAKGIGACYIDQYGTENRLKVSGRYHINETLCATIYDNVNSTRYHNIYQILVENYTKPRVSGSVAVDLAYLAGGKFDIALYNEIMLWDVAAGLIIAQEAGANFRVLCDNHSVNDQNPRVNGLLVANNKLLMDILDKEKMRLSQQIHNK